MTLIKGYSFLRRKTQESLKETLENNVYVYFSGCHLEQFKRNHLKIKSLVEQIDFNRQLLKTKVLNMVARKALSQEKGDFEDDLDIELIYKEKWMSYMKQHGINPYTQYNGHEPAVS